MSSCSVIFEMLLLLFWVMRALCNKVGCTINAFKAPAYYQGRNTPPFD